jgi:hypothetical protein
MKLWEPEIQQKMEILTRLMELVKPRGSVWCDGGLPKIRYEMIGDPVILSWKEAGEITGVDIEDSMRKSIQEKIRQARLQEFKRPMAKARTMEYVSDEEMDRRAIEMDKRKQA